MKKTLAARAVDGTTLVVASLLLPIPPDGLPRLAGYAALMIAYVASRETVERHMA
jgi:hypothetical protein